MASPRTRRQGCKVKKGLGSSWQEGTGKREQARRLSLGKPFREPRQTPASSGGWRRWLDTVFCQCCKELFSGTVDRFRDRRQFSVQPAGLFCTRIFLAAWPSHAPQSSHERSLSAPRGWLFNWAPPLWSLCTGSEKVVDVSSAMGSPLL